MANTGVKVVLVGRIKKTPTSTVLRGPGEEEIRKTVANMAIVRRTFDEKTGAWDEQSATVQVIAFGDEGTTLSECKTGEPILVEGELLPRDLFQNEDRDPQTVRADRIQTLSRRPS
jgi:single-stranded DNA-binding protein